MTVEERERIYSNEYMSLIFDFYRKDKFTDRLEGHPINRVGGKYAVAYYPYNQVTRQLELEYEYASVPKLFGLLDTISLESMGVSRVQNIPRLGLMGKDVLLGFVDTGLDYTNPAFRNTDGTTRILSIWDQELENPEASERTFNYGTEFTREEINMALQSEEPFSIVPSRDDIGHGTILAGVAGGSPDSANNFRGVVTSSEFVVVKLKQAKQNVREFFFVPEDVACFQEDDIMFAISYLIDIATQANKPIVICIGLGTNQGSHSGEDILTDFIEFSGNQVGIAFVASAGNEGNSGGHYSGEVEINNGYLDVELNIGPEESGFSLELWGESPNHYYVEIFAPESPGISQMQTRFSESRQVTFLAENTIVYVDFLSIEPQSVSPLILLRFADPAPGVWRLRVHGRGSHNRTFNMWLPITSFISPETYFINADPNTTITSPGNGYMITTVTAYNAITEEIFIDASRGFTRDNIVKPDITAPGVDVMAPIPGPENSYTRASGTSVAAAHATGLAAMIFEWGIVRGNFETMGTQQIQSFLTRGAQRDPFLSYPNNIWGYGIVNIYNIFLSLSSSII